MPRSGPRFVRRDYGQRWQRFAPFGDPIRKLEKLPRRQRTFFLRKVPTCGKLNEPLASKRPARKLDFARPLIRRRAHFGVAISLSIVGPHIEHLGTQFFVRRVAIDLVLTVLCQTFFQLGLHFGKISKLKSFVQ